MMHKLLILRPEPGGAATAARARAAGFDPIVSPLFEVHPLRWQPPAVDGFDAVMITSANAARQAGEALRAFVHLPLYAVGRVTADAARGAGFENITAGETDGATLVKLMAQDGIRRAFHPTGVDRHIIPATDVEIVSVAVYIAKLVDPPPRLVDDAVVLLHSPRAARHFAALTADRSTVRIATISAQVAEAAGPGWAAIAVADRPDDEALLAAASRLCD